MDRRKLLWGLIPATAVLALIAVSCSGDAYPGDLTAHISPDYARGRPYSQAGLMNSDLSDPEGSGGECFFPTEIAGLRLSSAVSGEKALLLVRKFLGLEYNIVDSYISCYSGEAEELFFWIVKLDQDSEAGLLLEQMEKRIKNSPYFCDYEGSYHAVVGELYYARFSNAANHLEHNFFYRKESRVYWVSIRGENPAELLDSFLDLL